MSQLHERVLIITGASSGMGEAIAERFAREGARLVISGRDEERGNRVATHIMAYNDDVVFVAGDVSRPETNRLLVETAVSTFGRLDGIVTNAGQLGLGPVDKLRESDWHFTFGTNVHAVYYLSRYAIPEFRKSGKGVILVNASIAATKVFPNHAAYCASKAAAVALVRQMALDYGPAIRVNAICPGPVDTPLIWDSAQAFPDPDKAVEEAAESTALKRLGKPTDVADLALFLASDASSWMTGSVVTIDGGRTLVG
jgi:NAD(P)-dependent dehydrogenase (short-subunit alcohol dehydrogenase family)